MSDTDGTTALVFVVWAQSENGISMWYVVGTDIDDAMRKFRAFRPNSTVSKIESMGGVLL